MAKPADLRPDDYIHARGVGPLIVLAHRYDEEDDAYVVDVRAGANCSPINDVEVFARAAGALDAQWIGPDRDTYRLFFVPNANVC